jgi:hypothetical protein
MLKRVIHFLPFVGSTNHMQFFFPCSHYYYVARFNHSNSRLGFFLVFSWETGPIMERIPYFVTSFRKNSHNWTPSNSIYIIHNVSWFCKMWTSGDKDEIIILTYSTCVVVDIPSDCVSFGKLVVYNLELYTFPRRMRMMTTTMLLNLSTMLQLLLHKDWNGFSILTNLVSLEKTSLEFPKA